MSQFIRTARSAAVVGTALMLSGAGIAGKVVPLSEVPDAVKATITQYAKGATPTEIELENEDGRQIYSVEFKDGGKEREIEIGMDGTFIKEDTDNDDADDRKSTGSSTRALRDDDDEVVIDPATAPSVVKEALVPILKGAPIKKMYSERDNGKVVYEAEYDMNGQEHSAEISADGKVLELENPIPAESLPAAVTAAVKAAYPSGTVKVTEDVIVNPGGAERRYFEVKLQNDGKTHELKVDANGKILKDEIEDDD